MTDPNLPYRHKILAVAPMMDWTDRHCRFFHRLLAPQAVLYTEMVTTGALRHGDRARHLDFTAAEHPLVLQLGGSDPDELAFAAELGAQWGYDEISLNCGCPSDRVQQGRFGACLMREPGIVATAVKAMRRASGLPVSVKCRIGVDGSAEPDFLHDFIHTVSTQGGCTSFIIHARQAWLKGLDPKENRTIPPLRYELVANLKQLYPQLTIMLNGGLNNTEDVRNVHPLIDGVMLGRAAYQNPYVIAELAYTLYGTPLPDRAAIARAMMGYIRERQATDPTLPIHAVTRHMLGLYHGQPGGKAWRRRLTERPTHPVPVEEYIAAALPEYA